MGLIKKFASVGGATMASRIFGFIRETMMAAALGVGPVADAFFAAFRFPNLFRRLFAEGAFNAAFVPLFAKEIEGGGMDAARVFGQQVLSFLFTVLLLITIAMQLSMPFLVRWVIAPGFVSDAAKFELTVRLAFIMFPYLMCMSLAAFMSGILNTLHKYFIAAIAPIFLNIILIGVLLYGFQVGHSEVETGIWLAWGVLAAGIAQLGLLTFAVYRQGMRFRLTLPKMTPNIKRLLLLAGPAAIAGGVTQINLVVSQMIASQKAGAISVLQYADRVYQLPLGVVGVAVSVVLLPELARALKGNQPVEAAHLQNRSVEFALFLTLPAAAALVAVSPEIVRVLYERGAFTAEISALVASVLSIFAIGLPSFVLIKALTPGYFAREDTRTPMIFAGVSVAVNIVLALTLFPILFERGSAIAETAAGWVNAMLLFIVLYRRGHFEIEKGFLRRIFMLVLSSAIMGGALWFAARQAAPWLASNTFVLIQAAALAVILGGAFLLYLGLTVVTGGADLKAVKASMKRKPKA
ncbi:MAG: murein biosynthesis integral membrane protein MurJ [Notoacmeibacter sp.]